jgi:hypothetical protein
VGDERTPTMNEGALRRMLVKLLNRQQDVDECLGFSREQVRIAYTDDDNRVCVAFVDKSRFEVSVRQVDVSWGKY